MNVNPRKPWNAYGKRPAGAGQAIRQVLDGVSSQRLPPAWDLPDQQRSKPVLHP